MPVMRMETFEPIPAGTYKARITKIEMVEGKFGPQLRWAFKVLDDITDEDGEPWDGEPMVFAYTPQRLTTKNKMGDFARWLTGQKNLPDDIEFDTDEYLNKVVKLVLAVVPSRTNPDVMKNEILSLAPVSTKPKLAAVATPTEDDLDLS